MPQLTVISTAVSVAMAIMRGERSAAFTSDVRPSQTSTRPASGTDQMIRCATTSGAGICATAFMKKGRKPQSR